MLFKLDSKSALLAACFCLAAAPAWLSAQQFVVESEGDWNGGTVVGLELTRTGRLTLPYSMAITKTVDKRIHIESFENTVTSAAFFSNAFTNVAYVTQSAGIVPLHGNKLLELKAGAGGPKNLKALSVVANVTMSAWFYDANSDVINVTWGMGISNTDMMAWWRWPTDPNFYIRTYGAVYGSTSPPTPIRQNRWIHTSIEHFKIAPSSTIYTHFYVNGERVHTYATANPTDHFRIYGDALVGTVNPNLLEYWTLSSHVPVSQTALRSLNFTGLRPGYRYDIVPTLAPAAFGLSLTQATKTLIASSTSESVPWLYNEPNIRMHIFDPQNGFVGSLTTTGESDAFVGNSLALSMSYTASGTWEKAWSFGNALTEAASVSWQVPTLPANTTVLLDYAVAVSPTAAWSGWSPVPGSGQPISLTAGNSELKVRVTLNSNDGYNTPSITKLWVDYTNPNVALPTSTPTVLTQQSSLPFVAWNYPNPFKADGTTTTRIVLDRNVQTTVRIFDPAGKEIFSTSTQVGIGRAEFNWDGKDTKGEALPSGIYFAKFDADTTVTCKIALLRTAK